MEQPARVAELARSNKGTWAPRPEPGIRPEREQKFLIDAPRARALVDAIRPHVQPEIWDPERPVSYTRTTYFDTDDRVFFRSGADRIARRLRVREYASARQNADPPLLTGICSLELKESSSELRAKCRFLASSERVWRIVRHGPSAADLVEAPAVRAIARYLDRPGVSPCVTTLYRRVAFVAENGCVRITIDHDLRFFRPPPDGEPGAQAQPPEPSLGSVSARILEVKTAIAPPPWLVAALEELPAAEGFSKFELGTLAATLSTCGARWPGAARVTRLPQCRVNGRTR